MNLDLFKELANVFKENGFDLFLVGGSVRDYLLTSSFSDADFVSNASVDDMEKFLKVKSKFKKYESGKFIYKDEIIDITSLRIEEGYKDFRHPSIIKRVNTPKEEYSRRDFTINALYMDKDENILDYIDGINDLKEGVIRMIGDPNIRLQEDPLRILRALRFSNKLGFKIDEDLLIAINKHKALLEKLNKEKVKEELKKFLLNEEDLFNLLNSYKIDVSFLKEN